MQISKWTPIPVTKPASAQFVRYLSQQAKTGTLRVRKIDNYALLWPLLTTNKTIDLGTADYEWEITLANDTFEAAATNTANWTFDPGTTNLVIANIAKDSDTQCTVTFAAQPEWGQLDISNASASKLAQLAISKTSASEIGQLAIAEDSASKLGQIAVARKAATPQPTLILSGVTVLDVDPTFTVDLTNGTFLSEAACENVANWAFNWGTSNLVIDSISYVGPTQVTIATTGTAAAASTVTMKAESSCLGSAYDSAVASYDMDTEVSSSSPNYYDPVYTATLSETTFTGQVAAELLTNWVFEASNSGLTLESITYVDATHVELVTDGTENRTDGEFAINALAATQTNGVDSGVCTYDCQANTSTCTDTTYGLNPVYAVTLTEATFVSEATCENVANWTFNMGTTGLSVASVTYVGAGSCTIETTGIAAVGTFTAQVKAAAMSDGYDSGVCSYVVATDASTCTASPYGTDLVLGVVLSEDTFQSEATCNDTANWTFDMGTSGLTVTGVTWANNTTCSIATSGLATAGTITAMVENAALTRNYDSGVCSYVIATDVSNCTDADYGVDPVYAVVLTDDIFTSEANCNNAANWTFDWTSSGLALSSITWSDANNCSIATTGIALDGSFTAQCKAALMTQGLASGVATYTVATDTSTCTDAPRLVAGTVTMMAEAAALAGTLDSGVMTANLAGTTSTSTVAPEILITAGIDTNDVDPSLRVLINNDAFISPTECEIAANWTIDEGTTGLTFDSVTWIDERTADVNFTGTAAAGDIEIAIAATAFVAGATPEVTYAVDEAEWGGSFTQSDIEGTIDAYQYLPGDPMEAYAGNYAIEQKSGYNVVDINLMASDTFDPRLDSSFVYIKAGGEATTFTMYGKLILGVQ